MRRGNGDGGIFKLSGKRRKPYAVRITTGWTDEGKQQYKYIGYFENKTAAKKALNEYLINPQTINIVTFADVFENMLKKSDFSPSTERQYKSAFKQLSELHNKNINEIQLDQLEAIVERHTPSIQLRLKNTLSNCYKYAMRYDYVSKNLADFLNVKTVKAKERSVFTIKEINDLWKNLGTVRFDDIPLILLYSGLRISELLGLETSDVDLKNKTLNIRSSKTKAGIRVVPIHDKIFPLIEKRYKAANSHFVMVKGKPMTYAQFNMSYWSIKNHTIHETRHTFTTQIQKYDVDKLVLKKIIGHATTDITDHYTHRTLEELKAEINKLKY